MSYVITENCIECRHTDCVNVCPVDCFHAGPNFLVIDPDECIDCAVCVPECPVNAIMHEDDVPADQKEFIQLNRELSKSWPILKSATRALPQAKEMNGVSPKLHLLKRELDQ